MVYPVVSLFQSKAAQGDDPVPVSRLSSPGEWSPLAEHPAEYLRLLPENIWAFLLLDEAEALMSIAARSSPTEANEHLQVVASTTAAEADEYGPLIAEFHLAGGRGWSVLNTGLIEQWAPTWGLERFHHQRRAFLRPTLPRHAALISATRSSSSRSCASA
jgi:hypothetical protein